MRMSVFIYQSQNVPSPSSKLRKRSQRLPAPPQAALERSFDIVVWRVARTRISANVQIEHAKQPYLDLESRGAGAAVNRASIPYRITVGQIAGGRSTTRYARTISSDNVGSKRKNVARRLLHTSIRRQPQSLSMSPPRAPALRFRHAPQQ